MSPIAQQAISRAHAILRMDPSPVRFQWMQDPNETYQACLIRRTEWLRLAGCVSHLKDTRTWEQLPKLTRDKLSGVAV